MLPVFNVACPPLQVTGSRTPESTPSWFGFLGHLFNEVPCPSPSPADCWHWRLAALLTCHWIHLTMFVGDPHFIKWQWASAHSQTHTGHIIGWHNVDCVGWHGHCFLVCSYLYTMRTWYTIADIQTHSTSYHQVFYTTYIRTHSTSYHQVLYTTDTREHSTSCRQVLSTMDKRTHSTTSSTLQNKTFAHILPHQVL